MDNDWSVTLPSSKTGTIGRFASGSEIRHRQFFLRIIGRRVKQEQHLRNTIVAALNGTHGFFASGTLTAPESAYHLRRLLAMTREPEAGRRGRGVPPPLHGSPA